MNAATGLNFWMDPTTFYQTLNPLERDYWQAFDLLFQRVQARKPEKGIQVLLLRAREQAEQQGLPLAAVLSDTLQAATERTERRIALLSQCALSNTVENEPG